MDAILTMFVPATSTRGSRVKAMRMTSSPRAESATIGYDHGLNSWDNHRAAAEVLITKLGWTDVNFVGGQTGTGTVWVAQFLSDDTIRVAS